MDIALLNTRIVFQKSVVVTDDIGNHMNEWLPYYSCMATISGEAGRLGTEERDAGIISDHSDLSITIRYCKKTSAVTTTEYRIMIGEDIYNITAIDHMSYEKKALKFKCQKVRR